LARPHRDPRRPPRAPRVPMAPSERARRARDQLAGDQPEPQEGGGAAAARGSLDVADGADERQARAERAGGGDEPEAFRGRAERIVAAVNDGETAAGP